MVLQIQSTPHPITPISGLTKKWLYWKLVVNGVIYNQEKTYSGIKNQQRDWGGGSLWRGGIEGRTVYTKISCDNGWSRSAGVRINGTRIEFLYQ